MCEANAYLHKDGSEELLMESVDKVLPQEDGLLLENIFGQRKFIKARIKEMKLVDHRIILEETK
ncbi:MAG: CooT family nickel-binding protein [Thermoanaerobacteraceae bacterium]|nr:CooT family nickel-binding protein [Thermoanaerobacteraceae bacterium]